MKALTKFLLIFVSKSINFLYADNRPISIHEMLKIEDVIQQSDNGKLGYDVAKERIYSIINKINEPRILYAMAIILYEGYEHEFYETERDRILFHARGKVVYHLCELDTKESYRYFSLLHNLYGKDGGASLRYKHMDQKFSLENK